MRTKLFAPKSYWEIPPDELKAITGGCGPGKIGDYLVPDNIDWPWPWGMSIRPSCNIHDFMYHIGKTLEDKERADRVFLNNMLRQIEAGNRWVRWRRRRRAWIYYTAVDRFGGPAYWKGKNQNNEEREV